MEPLNWLRRFLSALQPIDPDGLLVQGVSMLVIPAIDLKDGRCVRLRQGDMAAETVYSDDVTAVAARWQRSGAVLIHIVDLNGAVDGRPKNLAHIEKILSTV